MRLKVAGAPVFSMSLDAEACGSGLRQVRGACLIPRLQWEQTPLDCARCFGPDRCLTACKNATGLRQMCRACLMPRQRESTPLC
jgi:hypothetical protein